LHLARSASSAKTVQSLNATGRRTDHSRSCLSRRRLAVSRRPQLVWLPSETHRESRRPRSAVPCQEQTLLLSNTKLPLATGERFCDLASSFDEELRHRAEGPVLQGHNSDRPTGNRQFDRQFPDEWMRVWQLQPKFGENREIA